MRTIKEDKMSKISDWILCLLFFAAIACTCAAIIANKLMLFEYVSAAIHRLGEALK